MDSHGGWKMILVTEEVAKYARKGHSLLYGGMCCMWRGALCHMQTGQLVFDFVIKEDRRNT